MLLPASIDAQLLYGEKGLGASDAHNARHRERLWLRHLEVAEEVWEGWEWPFKYAVGQSLALTSGNNNANGPSDIHDEGMQGGLYDTAARWEVKWMHPHQLLERRRVLNLGTDRPEFYTVIGWANAAQVPVFEFDRSADQNYTFTFDYVRRRPHLMDRPAAVATAAGAAGALTGDYKYRLTYVTADGETIGLESATLTVAAQRITVSSIPTVPSFVEHILTSRKLYRTVAGGSVYKLVTTFTDNTTTTYSDNTADGSLGADITSTSYTGLERWPEDLQLVIHAGVKAHASDDKGQVNPVWERRYLRRLASARANYRHGVYAPERVGTGLSTWRMH